MGGNARKRRIVAASRNAAKEKAATAKVGPSTKVDPKEVEERRKKQKQQEENARKQNSKPKSSWTGKSPLDLLHEHLQKEKWTRARWREQNTSQDIHGKALFTWKVSLFHPKTEERLFFRTCVFADKIDPGDTTEQTWNSKQGSKQNAALVALSHFFPKQSLHLHIAPEYRSVWHFLSDQQQVKQEVKKEREEKAEHRKERQKYFDDLEKKNELTRMNVAMTERTRKLCNDLFLDLDLPNGHREEISIPKKVQSSLVSKGFTVAQINEFKAFAPISKNQRQEEQENILLETLLLRLPESQLPAKYKPSEGNFEVVRVSDAGQPQKMNSEARKQIDSLSKDHQFLIECVEQLGFTEEQILEYLTETDQLATVGSIVPTALALYHKICLLGSGIIEPDCTKQETKELRAEEEETLRSMFDEDFEVENLQFGPDLLCVWRLPFDIEGESLSGTLVVFFPSESSYPYSEPWLKIEVENFHPEICQNILRFLFFAHNDPLDVSEVAGNSPSEMMISLSGTQMVYSVLLWLQQYTSSLMKKPVPRSSELSQPTEIENIKKRQNKQQHKKEPYKEYLQPILSSPEVNKISQQVLQRETENRKAENFKRMSAARKNLPADKFKQKIVDLYQNNDVLVISGETGCGKTTQIPQFLLEYFIDSQQAGYCNMICTQPRRLSAIGVASRVAKERNERMEERESLVGYHVRLQKQISESCRLVFCTVGILLRRLQQLAQASHEPVNRRKKRNLMNEYLSSLSCIIIDEVHERSLDCDFLLIILKQFMLHRPEPIGGRSPLKIILMSATISTESFIQYFDSKNLKVSSFHIPGFTFPVEQTYLPGIIKSIGFHQPENTNKKGKQREEYISQLQQELPNESESTIHTLSLINQRKIDYSLIQKLIAYIAKEEFANMKNVNSPQSGSILVFLPGLAEISKLRNILNSSEISSKCIIHALHSSIPLDKQQMVFDSPPQGKLKVVLSTNIAETSVTIPDVVYVIDTGKVKQMQYDPSTQISTLQETFISRSSANQRSGRAGRVRKGKCFKVYTKSFFQGLNQFDTPEIFRVPLHQVYLLTCIFLSSKSNVKLDTVNRFLSSAIESPSDQQLQEAQNYLIAVGALRVVKEGELYLTPLGCHISKLPMDVRMAKLLIFSSVLRCVNPILTICAVLSFQSPMMSPIDNREVAKEMQKKFKRCKSDHISYHIAYEAFLLAKSNGNAHQFCKEHFLSMSTMYMIGKLRKQFIELLADIGFISYNKRTNKMNDSLANEQQYNMKVIQACLCAGLYPNVIKIQPPIKKYTKIAEGGTIEKSVKVRELKFFTSDRKRVFVHPSSFNFDESGYESVWMVYLKIMETSRVFVHDTTMVYPYPMLLFGSNNISIDHEKGFLVVDGWMYFEADLRVGIIIRKLREELDKILEEHINLPHFQLDDPLFDFIIKVIQYDGLLPSRA